MKFNHAMFIVSYKLNEVLQENIETANTVNYACVQMKINFVETNKIPEIVFCIFETL